MRAICFSIFIFFVFSVTGFAKKRGASSLLISSEQFQELSNDDKKKYIIDVLEVITKFQTKWNKKAGYDVSSNAPVVPEFIRLFINEAVARPRGWGKACLVAGHIIEGKHRAENSGRCPLRGKNQICQSNKRQFNCGGPFKIAGAGLALDKPICINRPRDGEYTKACFRAFKVAIQKEQKETWFTDTSGEMLENLNNHTKAIDEVCTNETSRTAERMCKNYRRQLASVKQQIADKPIDRNKPADKDEPAVETKPVKMGFSFKDLCEERRKFYERYGCSAKTSPSTRCSTRRKGCSLQITGCHKRNKDNKCRPGFRYTDKVGLCYPMRARKTSGATSSGGVVQ